MSKVTDYLVEQIWSKDREIAELHNKVSQAWSEGWHEHYMESERQMHDPSHPITKRNPYAPDFIHFFGLGGEG